MNTLKISLSVFLSVGLLANSAAREVVKFPFPDADGKLQQIDGILRVPPNTTKSGAVLILHGAGGSKTNITSQYGELFASNGFVSLELNMFEGRPENPQKHLSQVFGAIGYLAQRAEVDRNNISVMGLSYGGSLSLYAATAWAGTKYNSNNVPVRSIAALYPTCFFHEELAKQTERVVNRMTKFGFPGDFYKTWSNIPIKIFIGGQDDFENRDPKSCQNFVMALQDEAQRKNISIELYPQATHGWDHGRTYSFRDPLACKWAGCENTNKSDTEVTEKVKEMLVNFFK
jgi:dienelactone hydrolase